MTEQEQTTGTPAEDGGDAAETQTTGTPAADDRNAVDANIAKLNLEWKAKAERTNAAEAELKAIRAREAERAQSPAARGADPRAERLRTVAGFANGTIGEGPDPVAAEVLALREELSMALNEVANLRELDRVTDDTKRDKIKDHFNANRHRLGDVKAARAELERDDIAVELEAAKEREDKLRKALEATSKRQNPDVVQTHAREVTAAEHQARKMTNADWSARQKQLDQQYDAGNLEAGRQLRLEQTQRRQGKIVVED